MLWALKEGIEPRKSVMVMRFPFLSDVICSLYSEEF